MSNLEREIVEDFVRRLAEVDGITDELAARLGAALGSPHGIPNANALVSLITDATQVAD